MSILLHTTTTNNRQNLFGNKQGASHCTAGMVIRKVLDLTKLLRQLLESGQS